MSTVVTLLTILAKYGPAAYEAAIKLFKSKEPTEADLNVLLLAVQNLDYNQAIEDAKLRAQVTATLSGGTVQ